MSEERNYTKKELEAMADALLEEANAPAGQSKPKKKNSAKKKLNCMIVSSNYFIITFAKFSI